MTNGGYDDGYESCPCFWGSEPGSYVKLLGHYLPSMQGLKVLDAGCGEGKNAVYAARRGAHVEAMDISHAALRNGRRRWPDMPSISWSGLDIREAELPVEHFDVVIAYGLLHCMPTTSALHHLLCRLQSATRVGGYHVICSFNTRRQELGAHPGFSPTLIGHTAYLDCYGHGWNTLHATDTDLTERHPHNNVEHVHSLTRILARKISE